jgi:hypothetical protein
MHGKESCSGKNTATHCAGLGRGLGSIRLQERVDGAEELLPSSGRRPILHPYIVSKIPVPLRSQQRKAAPRTNGIDCVGTLPHGTHVYVAVDAVDGLAQRHSFQVGLRTMHMHLKFFFLNISLIPSD